MLKNLTGITSKLLFIIILVMFTTSNYAQFERKIWNWGFEEVDQVDSNFIEQYNLHDERSKNPAFEIVTDAAISHSGNKAMMLFNTMPDSTFMWPSFELHPDSSGVLLEAEREYELKFFVKGIDSGTVYSIWNVGYWGTPSGQPSWFEITKTFDQDITEWTEITVPMTTPPDLDDFNSRFTFSIKVAKGIADTIYVDDISITKKSEQKWEWGFENITVVDSNFIQKYHQRDERGKKPAMELVTDPANVYSGSKALMFYNTQPEADFMWPSFWLILSDDSVALEPKTDYKLKFKAKGVKSGSMFSVWNVGYWGEPEGQPSWYNNDMNIAEDYDGWTEFVFDLTTPANPDDFNHDFNVAFKVPQGIADTLYLDDFVVEKVYAPDFEWTRLFDSEIIPNTEALKALLKFKDADNKNGDISLDTTTGYNSSKSIKFVNTVQTEAMAPSITVTIDSAFTSQSVYEISFWVKGNVSSEATFQIKSRLTDFINESIPASKYQINNDNWTQIKVKVRSPFDQEFTDDGYTLIYWENDGNYSLNIDDLEVRWIAANANITANIGFEEPDNAGDWPWGWDRGGWWGYYYDNSGYPRVTNNPDIDTIAFVWDNTVKYEGDYSLRWQATDKDVEFVIIKEGKRPFENGIRTNHQVFYGEGLYEVSYMVKIENFVEGDGNKGTWFSFRPDFNKYGGNVRSINQRLFNENGNPEWLAVRDTILFPANRVGNNGMMFYFSGALPFAEVSQFDGTKAPRAWIDNFEVKYLGTTAPAVDPMVEGGFIAERDSVSNDVVLKWKAPEGIANPIYHIMVEPNDNGNGNYVNNILRNPSFETPSADGSSPEQWVWKPAGRDQWTSVFGGGGSDLSLFDYPYEEDDVIDGSYAVGMSEADSSARKNGVVAWLEQEFDIKKLQHNKAYLLGSMVKYDNVHSYYDDATSGDEFTYTGGYPLPEGRPYYNDAGVHIQFGTWTWGHSVKRLFQQGYSDLVGSSDGQWVKHKLGLSFPEVSYDNYIGVGLGGERSFRISAWWSTTGATGEAIFDNVFVTPFDEIGTTTELTYTIKNAPLDKKWYAIYVEDPSGQLLPSGAAVTSSLPSEYLLVSVDNENIPLKYTLEQNYPNPFNPNTIIQYSLPVKQKVKLFIYDILGRKVQTLVNQVQNAGKYTLDFNASNLSSGVYFYQIKTDNFVQTKKMLLLK